MLVGTRWVMRHARWVPWLLTCLWLAAIAGALARLWQPRADWLFLVFLTLAAWGMLKVWLRWRRERFIRESTLPQFLKRKLRERYPHLTQKDAELVERGLRQFFLASSRSGERFVSMPSRVVDAMWHEFILHTTAYRDWCALALGRFLDHTPAEALGGSAKRNDGLRRSWYWACKDEAIDPRRPTRLPLLFALDTKLQIENGYLYVPDCHDIARKADGQTSFAYCAGDFADGSHSGDAGDFGGAESGDGGGDGGDGGGGDGGGGCGGGGD